MSLILASASPRRKELFKNITEDFSVLVSDVEEIVPDNLKDEEIPMYLAELKAEEIARQYPEDTVIGCDTSVFLDGNVLCKPKDYDDAYNMLTSLSGKMHYVITGCSIFKDGKKESFYVKTKVYFNKLSEREIREYLATDEPYDKAGSYGIQGKGSLFVQKIEGDYFNVVGLPISMLNIKLREKGCI